MNDEEHSVSSAVVPPRAISHAVDIANMYENAAVARCSGDIRPTTRTDMVWREFCNVYARITGTLIFDRSKSSASTEAVAPSSGFETVYVEPFGDFGRREEVSSGCLFKSLLARRKGGTHDCEIFGEEGRMSGSAIMLDVNAEMIFVTDLNCRFQGAGVTKFSVDKCCMDDQWR